MERIKEKERKNFMYDGGGRDLAVGTKGLGDFVRGLIFAVPCAELVPLVAVWNQ